MHTTEVLVPVDRCELLKPNPEPAYRLRYGVDCSDYDAEADQCSNSSASFFLARANFAFGSFRGRSGNSVAPSGHKHQLNECGLAAARQ